VSYGQDKLLGCCVVDIYSQCSHLNCDLLFYSDALSKKRRVTPILIGLPRLYFAHRSLVVEVQIGSIVFPR